MTLITKILIGLVALVHIYIVYLEMFLWNTPKGQKAFQLTPEFALESKTLAANQGLYNGFLAAGLIWSLLHPNTGFASQLALFFLSCVAVAGLYGAVTVARKILFIQTIPALLALLTMLIK